MHERVWRLLAHFTVPAGLGRGVRSRRVRFSSTQTSHHTISFPARQSDSFYIQPAKRFRSHQGGTKPSFRVLSASCRRKSTAGARVLAASHVLYATKWFSNSRKSLWVIIPSTRAASSAASANNASPRAITRRWTTSSIAPSTPPIYFAKSNCAAASPRPAMTTLRSRPLHPVGFC